MLPRRIPLEIDEAAIFAAAADVQIFHQKMRTCRLGLHRSARNGVCVVPKTFSSRGGVLRLCDFLEPHAAQPTMTTSPSLESNERRRERTIWASQSTRMGLEDMNLAPEHPSLVKSPRGCRRRRQHTTQPASKPASKSVRRKGGENSQEQRAVLVFSTAKIQPPDIR